MSSKLLILKYSENEGNETQKIKNDKVSKDKAQKLVVLIKQIKTFLSI